MAGKGDSEATTGERALASPHDRIGSSALAGLEPQTSSPSLHAPASAATGGCADGAGTFCLLYSHVPLSCPTRPFSSRLVRAARSQRARYNRVSGDDPTGLDPSTRCS